MPHALPMIAVRSGAIGWWRRQAGAETAHTGSRHHHRIGAPEPDGAEQAIEALTVPETQVEVLRQNAFFPVVEADLPELTRGEPADEGWFRAAVEVVEPTGAAALLTVGVDGHQLKVQAAADFRAEPDAAVWLRCPPARLRFYDPETALALAVWKFLPETGHRVACLVEVGEDASVRCRWGAAVAAGLVLLTGCGDAGSDTDRDFTQRVVVNGLANPWEIVWGPDDRLWVTEKSDGEVTLVSVEDGTTETALTVPDVVASIGAQDGLLGLALHPDLLDGEPYVYLAYTYDDGQRRTKLVRYTYDPDIRTLDEPVDLLTGLPASNDHNAGRLVFGPDETLYYAIGDQGNNQFGRYCEPILAQQLPTADEVTTEDWTAYQGKILRLNLDGSIPEDNPELEGVRSHVYTYGHRNPQGLVFGAGDQLYSSEHGPKSDDEVNLIEAGGDYGWPHVAGYADDQAYVYADWSGSQDPPCDRLSYHDYEIPQSVPQQPESEYEEPFAEPLAAFYTVDSDHDFEDSTCAPAYFLCWPTVAPSSLDFYGAEGVPEWAGSLLMPSLKEGTVYRLPLTDGGAALGEPEALWSTVNRYRDTAVSPDGRSFYVATDRSGMALDGSGRPTESLEDPGAILEFTYSP